MIDMVEGCFYQRADGVSVGPAEKIQTAGRFHWFVGEWTYDDNGKFSYSANVLDLVKKVPARKKETVVA